MKQLLLFVIFIALASALIQVAPDVPKNHSDYKLPQDTNFRPKGRKCGEDFLIWSFRACHHYPTGACLGDENGGTTTIRHDCCNRDIEHCTTFEVRRRCCPETVPEFAGWYLYGPF